MRTVAIIGFGAMGSAVAQLFAQKDFAVRAYDTNQEALAKGIDVIKNGRFGLNRLVELGKLNSNNAEEILSKITLSTELRDAVEGVDIVVENVNEELDLKKQLFNKLDALCPKHVILASDTSSLSITSISAKTKHPERVIGMHLFMPPQIMPLVEIIKGIMTSQETTDKLLSISRDLGKSTIVSKDRPGFVVARLGLRQFIEACMIVEQGIASVKDVDIGARKGLGHPMGPFELTDLIGLDTRMDIIDCMFRETGDPNWKTPLLLRQLVESGYRGDPAVKKGSKGGFYEFFEIAKEEENK
jgi:3-hydroxybutyryl-CoA dehydrogenase